MRRYGRCGGGGVFIGERDVLGVGPRFPGGFVKRDLGENNGPMF